MTPEALHALETRRVAANQARSVAHRRWVAAGRALGEAQAELARVEQTPEPSLQAQNEYARSRGGVISPGPEVSAPDLRPKVTVNQRARNAAKQAQRERDEAQAALDEAQAECAAVEAEYREATREPTLAEMNARAREIHGGIHASQTAARERLIGAVEEL